MSVCFILMPAIDMLIAIYHILKDNIPFVDLGSEYHNQFNKERKINVYLKKLKALGWESDTNLILKSSQESTFAP